MNDTIKFWVDYVGGMDIVWLILICTAGTQLVKILLKAFRKLVADVVRPVPYLIGAGAGLTLLDFTSRGAMIGVACGMISSLLFFITMSYLERSASPDWQKALAARLQLK